MVNQVLGIANWRRQLVLAGGLLVVLGAGVVMALTIQRLQKVEEPVLLKPKANMAWPGCTQNPNNDYTCNSSDVKAPCYVDGGPDNQNIVKCCEAVRTSKDPFQCSWPARGWCPEETCNALPAGNKQACGLYYGITPACHPTCVVGKAINPSPTVWQTGVELAPTLKWMYNPTPSGGTPYANAYLWSCSARTDDCMVFASAPEPWDKIPVTAFYKPTGKGQNFEAGEWNGGSIKTLKANKQYWWLVTSGVTGCGVQTGADPWTFITGAGEPECTGGKTKCGSTCVDLKTDPKNCGACANVCPTGQSCTNSKCTPPPVRTCSVTVAQTASGPALTATAKGEGEANQAMRLWLEKQDGTRVTPLPSNSEEFNSLPDGGKYHYALGSCNATATKPCTVTKQPTNLAPGSYFAHCDIAIPLDAGKCSGNSFCSVNGGQAACTGWKSCSGTANQRGGDNVAFAVSGSVSRSCTISVSGTTVTATGKGEKASNQAMRVWLEKSDGARITPTPTGTLERNNLPDSGKYHYSLGSCNTTATNPCTVTKQLTGLSAGSYTTHCDIAIPDDANRCTGNSFCSVNGGTQACTGWKSCSANDRATLTVSDTSCPPGQTRCFGACVNLQTDRANCGACNQACTTGQVCTAGRCVTPPACTQDSDCPSGKVCRDGSCVEPPPQEDEISACWGNMGVEGKCFDCNGDGVINILDFSCFAKRWRETISQ